MHKHTLLGQVQVYPLEGDDSTSKQLVVATGPSELVEIPMEGGLAEEIAAELTMSNAELREKREAEMRTARARMLLDAESLGATHQPGTNGSLDRIIRP